MPAIHLLPGRLSAATATPNPKAFVTHFGKCIDEKTPLLRSMDAVKTSGLRLLKAINIGASVHRVFHVGHRK